MFCTNAVLWALESAGLNSTSWPDNPRLRTVAQCTMRSFCVVGFYPVTVFGAVPALLAYELGWVLRYVLAGEDSRV